LSRRHNPDNGEQCPICGLYVKSLGGHGFRAHGIRSAEFKQRFGIKPKKYAYPGRGARNWRKTEPWVKTYYYILARTKHISTLKNKNKEKMIRIYGNVKMLITKDELKHLWFRDKAYLLQCPSIDRIERYGDYEFTNCRYIEMIDNSSRFKEEQMVPVSQYTRDGSFVSNFRSMYDAVKSLGLPKSRVSGISRAVSGNIKTYRGYKWIKQQGGCLS
jgi:hypothetical protein